AWACSDQRSPEPAIARRWPVRAMRARSSSCDGRLMHINSTSQLEGSGDSGAWARAFAAIYDPFLWVGERAGVRAHRHDLLRRARGRTVDIGSGTGLNLAHYQDDLDELIMVEPDAAMRSRLRKSLHHSSLRARLVDAPAEHLPFPDVSID